MLQVLVLNPEHKKYKSTMCYICNETGAWNNGDWVYVIGYNLFNSTNSSSFEYYYTIRYNATSQVGYLSVVLSDSIHTFLLIDLLSFKGYLIPGTWFLCYYNVLDVTEVEDEPSYELQMSPITSTARLIPMGCGGIFVLFAFIGISILTHCPKERSSFLTSPKAVLQGKIVLLMALNCSLV